MPFIIIIAYLFYLVVVLMHSGIAFSVRCKSLKRRHAYEHLRLRCFKCCQWWSEAGDVLIVLSLTEYKITLLKKIMCLHISNCLDSLCFSLFHQTCCRKKMGKKKRVIISSCASDNRETEIRITQLCGHKYDFLLIRWAMYNLCYDQRFILRRLFQVTECTYFVAFIYVHTFKVYRIKHFYQFGLHSFDKHCDAYRIVYISA